MNRSRHAPFDRFLSQFAVVAVGLIAPIACAAQTGSITTQKMGAREVLTRVEQRARSGGFAVPDVVKNPENYPRSTVDSVVQGLENLALGKEPESVRSGAAVALASAGSDKHIIAGVFDRKVQVYRKSTNNMVRGMIIAYIGEGQERGRAIEFLKSVATEDAPPGFDQAPYLAAHALVNFGVPGIAALRELDARGIVRDAKTSGFVKWILANPPQ